MDKARLEIQPVDELHLDPKKTAVKGKSIYGGRFPTHYLTIDGEVCLKDLVGHPLPTFFNVNTMLNSVKLYTSNDTGCLAAEMVALEELIIWSFFQEGVYDRNKHGIMHRDGNIFNTSPHNLELIPKADHEVYAKKLKSEIMENLRTYKVDIYFSSNQFSRKKIITGITLRQAAALGGISPELAYLMAKMSKEHMIDIERNRCMILPHNHTPIANSGSSLDKYDYLVYWNHKDDKKKKIKLYSKLSDLASPMCMSRPMLESLITTHINRCSTDMIATGAHNDTIELWMEKDFMVRCKDLYDTVSRMN